MLPRKRILIVEDSADTRFVYAAILNLDGYEVLEAPDGESGVGMALEQHPDLVITDINMPGLSGFDVARRIRADERTPRFRSWPSPARYSGPTSRAPPRSSSTASS